MSINLLQRPKRITGFFSWVTTVDHKKIGIMYIVMALLYFVIAGCEALLIRLQLFSANGSVLTANFYNQLFTMHGTTMIFLVGMPIGVGLANYFIPLMMGGFDVPFPRLNMFGFWIVFFGGLFMYSSFFLGGAPDGGWFGYTPLTSSPYSSGFLPGRGADFWTLSLIMLGIGSTTSGINIVVTVINLRAKGMSLMKMPIFTWMMLIVGFLTMYVMPVFTGALIMVFFDRNFGTTFFFAATGGDPHLYQHLFWIFGHPEVYILMIPGMGIISEILPVFAKKPIFGYPAMVFASIGIGFVGFGVWAHHMFSSGMGPVALTAFGLSTMMVAVPTGVKVFNWLATIWGGSIRYTVANLYGISFIAMFTLGGISGVMHAVVPADTQQTDTYFVVAHFHYILFGGLVFALLGGLHYWYPKIMGKMLNEKLGKWGFWATFIGFNGTFAPLHVSGLIGQARRTWRYQPGKGFEIWNQIATISSFFIALGTLIMIINFIISYYKGKEAGNDPWDARTLEWSIPSPPPAYNFLVDPDIKHRDELWFRKYTLGENEELIKLDYKDEDVYEERMDYDEAIKKYNIHMPSPSILPMFVGASITVLAFSGIYLNIWVLVVGILSLLFSIVAWGLEPPTEETHEVEEIVKVESTTETKVLVSNNPDTKDVDTKDLEKTEEVKSE